MKHGGTGPYLSKETEMTSYFLAMRNFLNFSGRTSRRDYWLFVLIMVLVMLLAAILEAGLSENDEGTLVLTSVVWLVHLVPALAAGVRRLHDSDKSGFWILVGFIPFGSLILLVLFCFPSTAGENRFGPEPDHSAPVKEELARFGRAAARGEKEPEPFEPKRKDGPWN